MQSVTRSSSWSSLTGSFRKYNIMRILDRNNAERSSPSVNTNHTDLASRLQMCASVEHRYRTSLVLKIDFPLESILKFVTSCSRHMNLNVKVCFFTLMTSPTYSNVLMHNNSPIPHTAKLLLKIIYQLIRSTVRTYHLVLEHDRAP